MRTPIKKVFAILFWLILWEIIANGIHNTLLLVSPVAVFRNLIEMFQTKAFYLTILHSLGNILGGFTLAIFIGLFLAFLSYRFSNLAILFSPMINVMKITPVASFTIFALVFIHSTRLPMLVSFLMVMPLVYGNLLKGLQNTDSQLLEMAQFFQVSWKKQLRAIYLPAISPYFYTACQTGIGYAWKSAITAEVMVSPIQSLGKNIADAKIYFDTLSLFSWTVIVILCSSFVEKMLMLLLEKLLPKTEGRISTHD